MCDQYKNLMNAYLDGEITDTQRKELDLHVASCDLCMVEFEELKFMKELLEEEALMPLPEDFDERLHVQLLKTSETLSRDKNGPLTTSETIKEESGIKSVVVSLKDRFRHLSKASKGIGAIAAVFLVGVVFVNQFDLLNPLMKSADEATSEMSTMASEPYMSAPQAYGDKSEISLSFDENSIAGSSDGASYDNMLESQETITAGSNATRILKSNNDAYRQGRMILKTANVSIDVEDYDAVVDKIKSLIENTEGFIESEQMSYRTDFNDRDNLKYGSLVLRVPSGGFESILDDIRSEGNINYDNSYAEDVTKNYRDTASEIENLKITEERLRAILQQATEVEDILNIENELTRVRSQINAYTNQLKNWEDLSDLSYVYLEIVEVESLDPQITKLDDSLWSRAKFGFIETLNQVIVTFEQIVVWLVSKSPILVGLGFITWLLTRAWRKKSKVK